MSSPDRPSVAQARRQGSTIPYLLPFMTCSQSWLDLLSASLLVRVQRKYDSVRKWQNSYKEGHHVRSFFFCTSTIIYPIYSYCWTKREYYILSSNNNGFAGGHCEW